MLRSMKSLTGYDVKAADGELGKVDDFLLEDTSWVVRYLVVRTGVFMAERRVLIAPMAFRAVDYSARRFNLSLSMLKIENSPRIDVDLPVSRQKERDYYGYYGYPRYWGYGALAGGGPGEAGDGGGGAASRGLAGEPASDGHLRSARELAGYHVEGTDGAIGHVADVVVDDETWNVEYMVLATTNWWPGKSVLIDPAWATRVSWLDRRVYLRMTRDAIRASPEWTATYPVGKAYADQLFQHYAGTPGWVGRDRNVLAHAEGEPREKEASSGEGSEEEIVKSENFRAGAHEEEQIRAADNAVVRDARAGRMP